MEHVDIQMQGVRLRVRSNFAPLPTYLLAHLPHHSVAGGDLDGGSDNVGGGGRNARAGAGNGRALEDAPPDIDVNVRWFAAADAPEDALRFEGQDALPRIGKRHLANDETLVWTDTVRVKDLAFRFRLNDRRLAIEALYVYAPRADKLAGNPHYLERRLFSLTSWFVFHPLAWYLEHFRGLYLLHASGIETGGRAVVIPGVGGVGKTTTSVALVAQGARLISENLVFHDAAKVYACYEPIRMDARSVELLQQSGHALEKAAIPDGAKAKSMYQLGGEALVDEAPAGWLFIPSFTARSFVRELDVDECVERLVAFNELTREVDDYAWFAATLNLKWPTLRSLERRARTLRAFVDHMRRYEIGIDRARGIEPVLQAILERTRTGGVAP